MFEIFPVITKNEYSVQKSRGGMICALSVNFCILGLFYCQKCITRHILRI